MYGFSTSGTEINTLIGPRRDGPALLLLHGYPQTVAMWHKVAPRLAERFNVVACDLRGYGDSGKPPSMDAPFSKAARAYALVTVITRC